MKIGIFAYISERTLPITDVARIVESAGFESLWIGEHTHMPVGTRHPAMPSKPVPREYLRMPDPFVLLGAAAAVTSRLRLGTGVCVLAEHHPLRIAKAAATLSVVAGGRFELGVGLGWNDVELRNFGVDPNKRRERFAESLELVRRLWTEDETKARTEHFDISPSVCLPKPFGELPLVLGASGSEKNVDLLLRFCDGWMPIRSTEDAQLRRLEAVQARCVAAQRAIAITIMDPYGVPSWKRSWEAFAESLPDATVLRAHESVGVSRFIVGVPCATEQDLARALEVVASRSKPNRGSKQMEESR